MVAARRRDVTMIHLLVAHSADVSAVIHTDGERRLNKTALLVAATAGDERVITELVTRGADVNQSLGPQGTVLHHFRYNDKLVNLFVRLGADPNVKTELGISVLESVIARGEVSNTEGLDFVLESLRLLLPTTRNLDFYLESNRDILRLNNECTKLMLQH